MNFSTSSRHLESSCKAYAYRTRLQKVARVEELAGEANALPAGSPERKRIIAEIVALEAAE